MINTCLKCGAIREYPSGKAIKVCPMCGGEKILVTLSPLTKEDRDLMILITIDSETHGFQDSK